MMAGSMRTFNIFILDNQGNQVMRIYRPGKCWCGPCCSCCDCCSQEVFIEAPVGTVIGSAVSNYKFCCCSPPFTVYDANKSEIFKIEGPCNFCTCSDMDFTVSPVGGGESATITKQWSGYMQETYTAATNFGIRCKKPLTIL